MRSGQHARFAPAARAVVFGAAATVCHAGVLDAFVGGGPNIIAAPPSVEDDAAEGGAVNTTQQAFDERQGVVLKEPLRVDQGTIPAGTCVNSHMIFLNSHETQDGSRIDERVTWTFDGKVLGVMSDYAGILESLSNGVVGSKRTRYPGPFNARGLEGPDHYAIDDTRVVVSMYVSEPGDWIRVVTACTPINARTHPVPPRHPTGSPGVASLLKVSLWHVGTHVHAAQEARLKIAFHERQLVDALAQLGVQLRPELGLRSGSRPPRTQTATHTTRLPGSDRIEISAHARHLAAQAGERAIEPTAGEQRSETEQREIRELERRDAQVRAHERAHLAAAGDLARGGARFEYERGPNGQMYAVNGEVSIDTQPVPGDPDATLRKARRIQRAAHAPVDPSAQDHAVAREAAAMAREAEAEIRRQRAQEAYGVQDAPSLHSRKLVV